MNEANHELSNEISLMDIIHILKKYKKLFFCTVAAVTLLGIVFALKQEKQYVFTQPLYLGSYINGQTSTPTFFESTADVTNALQSYYIPQWTQSYNNAHQAINFNYLFNDASTASNNGIIYLTISITMKLLPSLQDLNAFILQQVSKNEAPLIASYIENANSNISILKNEIPKLERAEMLFDSNQPSQQSSNNILTTDQLATRINRVKNATGSIPTISGNSKTSQLRSVVH